LARLAMTEADAALLVADDHQRGEAEAPAALHDFGDAIDVNEFVDELALLAVAAAVISSGFTCHSDLLSSSGVTPVRIRSELQAALARGIAQGLDPAVVEIAATVEHHVLDALLDGALGDQLADRLGGGDVGAGLHGAAHVLLDR